MKRRDALVVIGAGAPLAAQQQQQHQHAPPAATVGQPGPLRFLSRAQFELVDHLTEMIIPTDAHSPGAHDASVAAYIDGLLAETGPPQQAEWARGLEAVDAEAKQRHGKAFMACTAEQQDALMKAMADGEESPKTDLHRFFVRLKAQTLSGYYTSSVGLLKDLQYKGIVPIGVFPPCNHPDHHRPAKRK